MFINHTAKCKTGPINLNQPNYSEERLKQELFNRDWYIILQNETFDMLLKDEKIYYDDIENLYRTDREIQEDEGPGLTEDEIEEIRDYDDGKEVFQWYLIGSDHLFQFLRGNDEVVAETDYGNYWGRTSFGLAITMTPIFDKYWDMYGSKNR
tara:strand:- start:47 stop:502 length:456 start_codon:yes stop_codon:yes gene_type:complete